MLNNCSDNNPHPSCIVCFDERINREDFEFVKSTLSQILDEAKTDSRLIEAIKNVELEQKNDCISIYTGIDEDIEWICDTILCRIADILEHMALCRTGEFSEDNETELEKGIRMHRFGRLVTKKINRDVESKFLQEDFLYKKTDTEFYLISRGMFEEIKLLSTEETLNWLCDASRQGWWNRKRKKLTLKCFPDKAEEINIFDKKIQELKTVKS